MLVKKERRDIPTCYESVTVFADGSSWTERHESALLTRWHNEGFGYDELDTRKYSDHVYGENLTLAALKRNKLEWVRLKNPGVNFKIKWAKVDY